MSHDTDFAMKVSRLVMFMHQHHGLDLTLDQAGLAVQAIAGQDASPATTVARAERTGSDQAHSCKVFALLGCGNSSSVQPRHDVLTLRALDLPNDFFERVQQFMNTLPIEDLDLVPPLAAHLATCVTVRLHVLHCLITRIRMTLTLAAQVSGVSPKVLNAAFRAMGYPSLLS